MSYPKCPICNQMSATRMYQGKKICPACHGLMLRKPTVTYVQIPESYAKADPNY